jgi:MoxR-like ATPase
MPESPLTQDDLAAVTRCQNGYERIRKELAKVIVGQEEVIEQVLVTMFSRGHALLEGVPGLAKTLMISSIADSLHLTFKRIQFTPDLMPSDITGAEVIQEVSETRQREHRFLPGPIFANLILADEINRTPPKTQAAMLEAMQERQISAGGKTHHLPAPFFVLATQNPLEQEGTYPLPEAQLDRFLLRLRLGYPSVADEIRVLDAQQLQHPLETLQPIVKLKEILEAAEGVKQIFISPAIKRYVVELTSRTRQSEDVYLGASPRGSLFLARAGQARAAMLGRDHVLPDDIQALAVAVLAHRIIVSPAARLRDLSSDRIVQEAIHATTVPGGEFSSEPVRKKTK